MIDSKVLAVYGEYGAIGIIVIMFIMMIINLIKSQKTQNEDLDDIRQHIAKMETTLHNVEGMVIKLIERWKMQIITTILLQYRSSLIRVLS